MNINDLIAIVKKKLKKEIIIENINVEDKSFLHTRHKGNDKKNITSKINLILLKRIGKPLIDKKFDKKKLKIFLSKELSN